MTENGHPSLSAIFRRLSLLDLLIRQPSAYRFLSPISGGQRNAIIQLRIAQICSAIEKLIHQRPLLSELPSTPGSRLPDLISHAIEYVRRGSPVTESAIITAQKERQKFGLTGIECLQICNSYQLAALLHLQAWLEENIAYELNSGATSACFSRLNVFLHSLNLKENEICAELYANETKVNFKFKDIFYKSCSLSRNILRVEYDRTSFDTKPKENWTFAKISKIRPIHYIVLLFVLAVSIAAPSSILLILEAKIKFSWLFALLFLSLSVVVMEILYTLHRRFVEHHSVGLPQAKFSYEAAIAVPGRVALCVPLLLDSIKDFEATVRAKILDSSYLAAEKYVLVFLTDFPDSPERLDDKANQERLKLALQAMEQIQNYTPIPIYLLHREQVWSASENRWMGEGRKSGKLRSFEAYLRGDANAFSIRFGPNGRLTDVTHIIVLDEDTRFSHASIEELYATAVCAEASAKSNFTPTHLAATCRAFTPRIRMMAEDKISLTNHWLTKAAAPLGRADWSQDFSVSMWGLRQFPGKGLYAVNAADLIPRSLASRPVLSHDVIEGSYMGTGFCAFGSLDEPTVQNYWKKCSQSERWARGDIQNLLYLLRIGRSPSHHFSEHGMFLIFNNVKTQIYLMSNGVLVLTCLALTVFNTNALFLIPVCVHIFAEYMWSFFMHLVRLRHGTEFHLIFKRYKTFIAMHVREVLRVLDSTHSALIIFVAMFTGIFRSIFGKNTLEWTPLSSVSRGSRVISIQKLLLAFPSLILAILGGAMVTSQWLDFFAAALCALLLGNLVKRYAEPI